MIYGILVVIFLLGLWNYFEVFKGRPYLATWVGNVLVGIFGYDVYQITYTDLTVYTTKTNLFEFRLFGRKFHLIPINAVAITFGEVVVVSTKTCNSWCVDAVLKHEFVHVDQYRKLGSIRFFALYLWFFAYNFVANLIACLRTGNGFCFSRALQRAYEDIPMEVEAREKSGY